MYACRVFIIVYIYIAVISVTFAIGNFRSILYEIADERKRINELKKPFDVTDLLEIDHDLGTVDKLTFVTSMLVKIEKLDMKKDIEPWLNVSNSSN
jgi:hypothetical protein